MMYGPMVPIVMFIWTYGVYCNLYMDRWCLVNNLWFYWTYGVYCNVYMDL